MGLWFLREGKQIRGALLSPAYLEMWYKKGEPMQSRTGSQIWGVKASQFSEVGVAWLYKQSPGKEVVRKRNLFEFVAEF